MKTALPLLVPLLLLAEGRRLPPTLAPPPPAATDAPGVVFAEVARAAGLGSFRRASGSPAKDYILEAKGGGVALLDADGDGALDVYLVNGASFAFLRGQEEAGASALYRNGRDGTFADITAGAGVANRGWGQGACTGDFDNDGDEDLYVTNFGPNRLYRNDGRGRFEDVAARAGVAAGGWSTGCAFGDYDGDGLLDLFVAGYIELDIERLPPRPSGARAPLRRRSRPSRRKPAAACRPPTAPGSRTASTAPCPPCAARRA